MRKFCEKIIDTEDRSHYLSNEDVTKLAKKYYLEMLIPFSLCVGEEDDELFGRNPINILSYHQGTFKKIHEKRDDFIYKGRAEDWRDEHYSHLEWRVIELMSELLPGDSLKYMTEIVKSKTHKRKKLIKHLFHHALF
jgi:hypothetical protein